MRCSENFSYLRKSKIIKFMSLDIASHVQKIKIWLDMENELLIFIDFNINLCHLLIISFLLPILLMKINIFLDACLWNIFLFWYLKWIRFEIFFLKRFENWIWGGEQFMFQKCRNAIYHISRANIYQENLFLKKLDFWDFPGGTVVKNPPANAGDRGSSPGPGRSHMLRSN